MKALLIVALAALTLFWYGDNRALNVERRKVRDLTSKLEEQRRSGSLDLQAKCAQQARVEFDSEGWSKTDMVGFQSHYNPKMNTCFMQVESTDLKQSPGFMWINKTLSNAFEGKIYGEYFWRSAKGKQHWEVPPFYCKVTLASGEVIFCKSDDEYEELTKAYMGM